MKTLLYGKNSIKERLKVQPQTVRCVFVQKGFKDKALLREIEQSGVPLSFKSEKELQRTKRADRLQGLIAEIEPYAYTYIDDLLDASRPEPWSILFLDGLNDPHNLGSILRIAACFGKIALCLPKHQSCEVNETVLHVCSGAENYVPVAQVSNFTNTLKKAKKQGFWVAGTRVDGGAKLTELKEGVLPFPLCLILGSEGKGMSPGLDKICDMQLNIPMQGAALSFNVAMASAIFCYEIMKQRA